VAGVQASVRRKTRLALAIRRVTAIRLLDDFNNILANHVFASKEAGKNMVGKNI
jgi:hypothetical protein